VKTRFQISRPVRFLLSYFSSYRKQLALGMVCLLVANLARLVMPILLRRIIDKLTSPVINVSLLSDCSPLLLAALVQAILLFCQRRILVGVARDVEFRIRNDFYAHLQTLPLQFYQKRRTGDLMARAMSDLASIRTLTGPGLISVLNATFAAFLILPMMTAISWRLTFWAFLPMPLLVLITQVFSKRIHDRSLIVQEHLGAVFSTAQEAITGVRVTRAYRQERVWTERFEQVSREFVKRNLSLIRLSAVLGPLIQFCTGISFIIIFWTAGNQMLAHTITIGQFIQFTMYVGFVWGPMIALGGLINLYQRARACMERITTIMNIQPAIRDLNPTETKGRLSGEIEFRGLTFNYLGVNESTLKDVNLTIAPGQTIAFVGSVGSGKSTLMNIVPRLLEAPQGQVMIDNRSIRDLSLKQVRHSIGYVPQETFVFSDTIANNIAFGVDSASTAEIEQAAREAGLAEDVATFPLGYGTVVGERGVTLSGGQKQRLAIARALMRRPSILILDDALSAVDAHTEERVLTQLRKILSGTTKLMVSHRVSTVKDADLIVVLQEGSIAEVGTHDQLLRQQGLYNALHEKQMLEDQLVYQ
jgi:ATP-binding cassette subfamily B protein